jgi:two-component system sensor histidine kinase KdpD
VAEPRGYLVGALVTTLTTAVAFAVAPHATLAHVMVIYLLGAVLVATRYGVAVSGFTIAASALCFDYFNIPPIFAFVLPDAHSVLTLLGMLVTTIIVCVLLHRLRYQRTVARASEARTLALCELSLDLSEISEVEQLPRVAERHLARLFGPSTRVLVRERDVELGSALVAEERELASRALERRELAVLEVADGALAFQPIASGHAPLGLIRVSLAVTDPTHEREQHVLLAACADRIAVAIDRLALGAAAQKAHVEAEAERLRNELLSAMSHDLKTPLASILTAGSTLLNPSGPGDVVRRELLETIVDEAERLNRLVTNLLSVTRLESGRVRLNKTPEALDELVYGVLSRLSGRLEGRTVEVVVPSELPFVSMDPVLVDQVMVNLIENVLRYTPAASPLVVRVLASEREVTLEVADRGPGIASDEREKVFEKFYRGSQAKLKDGGSGLGLTICRAVARAHGGRIQIHPRAGGGTVVEFVLPASAEPTSNAMAAWPKHLEVSA